MFVPRTSNFPPEFFPPEIIIFGKDEPETGIPVNFRHGNFRRMAEIPETFPPEKISGGKISKWFKKVSAGKVSGETFITEKFSTGTFPRKTNRVLQEQIFPLDNNLSFQEKITTDQLGTGSDHSFPRLVKKLNKFIYILASAKAPLKL